MKVRQGFVSNSSSSSFIIPVDNSTYKTPYDIAKYMIYCREFGDGDDKTIKKLKRALEDGIITKDTNLMFCSCNYDTYIIKDFNYNKIYITTCNNHDFDELYDFKDETDGELSEAKRDNNRFYYIEGGFFVTYIPYDNTGKNRHCQKKKGKDNQCYGEKYKGDDGKIYCIDCEANKFPRPFPTPKYPRTLKDLEKIYDIEYSRAGDTEKDFNEWAIKFLLDKINKLLNTEMNAHGETLEVILNKGEDNED